MLLVKIGSMRILKMNSTCPDIDIEDGPYPTDEWLSKFELWEPKGLSDAVLFFIKDLPSMFEDSLHPHGYAKVVEDKNGKWHVYLATGGWSGCESILGVLDHGGTKIHQWMFWRMSAAGGARWYEIPALNGLGSSKLEKT